MKTQIGNLLVAAVAVTVVSFFGAPVVAFYGIRSAAEASDVAGLVKLIDFAAVRASLRPQLAQQAQVPSPPPGFLGDPIGAIRRQFEQATVPAGPSVDPYLTPRAIANLTWGAGRAANNSATGEPEVVRGKASPRPAYWGVNRMRMKVGGPNPTAFTFERRGAFEWKLVHVGLPPQTGVSAPATPTVAP